MTILLPLATLTSREIASPFSATVGVNRNRSIAHALKQGTRGEGEMKTKWVLGVPFFAVTVFGQDDLSQTRFMLLMNASMAQMDRDMSAAPMNNSVDHDFVTMMIPHHQGAIDMAKAELSYGKDPVMRRLAQEIIVDQKSEIDAMQLWLHKNAVSTRKENQ
jgi:Domain of unknown function (DUF305)